MIEIREYQQKAINDVREAFKSNRKIILTAPTGSGKTVIALTIVKAALEKGKRIGFVCDRLTLLDQTANVMESAGIDFGIIQGQHELTDYKKQFQICSAQTLARRCADDEFDFIIIDEAHIVFKHQISMLKNHEHTFFLGLTATPFTKGLGKHWEKLVTGPSVETLIEQGFLSKYIAFGPSKPDLRGVKTVAGDYNKKQLAEKTDTTKLIGDIVDHWFKLAQDRQTIAMAVNTAHAEHIARSFQEKGIKADFIHCYLKPHEVQSKLIDFRKGEIQLLSSVDMISRGFDMPQANCLIIARPTKSLNYHLQAIGRVLRPAPGKENALILDHAGNFERLGFPDDEFEMVLNVTKEKETDAKKREKKEKLPKTCPKCFFIKEPGVQLCPQCGYETKRQPNVLTKEGELMELQKTRRTKATLESKDKIYSKLLAGAMAADFKNGWAYHQYQKHFGVYPARKNGIEPDEQLYDWLTTLPRGKMMRIVWGIAK